MIKPFIIKATAKVASFDNIWIFMRVSGTASQGTGQMSLDRCTADVVSLLRTVRGIGAHQPGAVSTLSRS